MHVGAKLTSPHDGLEVVEVMRGVRRSWKKPVGRKMPAVDEDIKRMVDAVEPQTLKGLRDRALLLLGFAGAFRRSELIALDTEHLTHQHEGLAVRIASSKTDQESRGQVIAIPRVGDSPYCPVPELGFRCSPRKIMSTAHARPSFGTISGSLSLISSRS